MSPVLASTPTVFDRISVEIRQSVELILNRQLSGFSDVSLNVMVKMPVRVPTGSEIASYNYQVVSYSNYLGKSYIPVQLIGPKGNPVGRIQVAVEANGTGSYIAAARQLSKGDVIVSSDLVVKRDTLLGQQLSGFGIIESLVGKEAVSAIAEGAMITKMVVRSVPDVRRGETVFVDFRNGPIQVRVNGVALGDARIGDNVKVRLKLESHRVMEGEVIDTTTVRIRSGH